MGHTSFYLTRDGKVNASEILQDFSDQITNIWKSAFPDGSVDIVSDTMYLSAGDIHVSIFSNLKAQYNLSSNKYIACTLRSSCSNGLANQDADIVTPTALVYGIEKLGGVTTGSVHELIDPIYLHIITGKQNKTIMLGLSDSLDRVGAQVLVSKLSDNDYVGIQLGVTTYDKHYNDRNERWSVYEAYNERWDVYVKDSNNISQTQAFYGPGWYVTSDILTIVPAIDPWRGELIPDTYISINGPLNKAGLDGVISIANRQFMTGHTYSHNGTGNEPGLNGLNEYILDGGIVTFVEI